MRTNQKGFSLIELIVVIAIMAALVGVLAPTYLSYLEKTRIQKDESAADEIFRTAELVVYSGECDVNEQVVATFDANGININATSVSNQRKVELLQEHFGSDYQNIKPVSRRYANKCYSVQILPPEEGSIIPRLVGSWS